MVSELNIHGDAVIGDIHRILQTVRRNLGLDVAFVSQFTSDRQIFRYVDAPPASEVVQEGRSAPLEGSYCKLVAEGLLPSLIADTRDNAIAVSLPATREVPVGAHLSVPIRMRDGTLFGSFCCFSHAPRPTLNERDLAMLRTFADIAGGLIERDRASKRSREAKERRIRSLIESGGPTIVYQPVFMIETMRAAGAEALSRFPVGEEWPVDVWFADAAEVGLQVELELQAIRNALAGYSAVWKKRRIQLGLNASAATICDARFWTSLEGYPRDLIVIELTEHEQVGDYTDLLAAVRRLRAEGTKIAIDDVGAGYASMRHVLTMRPDILKLDIGLIRSIDADDMRLALTSSLKHFADRVACKIVAEGVETEQELATLRDLGLQAAQGYLLARPGPPDALLEITTPRTLSTERRRRRA